MVTGTNVYGQLSNFDAALGTWRSLTLARSPQGGRDLQLTELRDNLRGALLSNQLFLVITDPAKFLDACSINYMLTAQAFVDLRFRAGVPERIIDRVRYLQDVLYFDVDYFDAALEAGLGSCAFEQWGEDFREYGGFAKLDIEGWSFDLSPYMWRIDGRDPTRDTIMIFKFADATLDALVDDLSLWTLPHAFNERPTLVQQRLRLILEHAVERVDQPGYDYFVRTVAGIRGDDPPQPLWNGVLYLNAHVPLTELPDELMGLAAGIDASQFQAHHIGINAGGATFENGVLSASEASLFGLIDYSDLVDLLFTGDSYAYKVLTLNVTFNNSRITNFSSQVELLVGRLFDELATLPPYPHGNNIILNGTLQRQGLEPGYNFLNRDAHPFEMASHVLERVIITRAQFVTEVPVDGQQPDAPVQTRFQLGGDLQFRKLDGLDLFSFGRETSPQGELVVDGRLRFTNLVVEMTFLPVGDLEVHFSFEAASMSFDSSQSLARPGSLYARFPLSLDSMLQGDTSTTPQTLGYLPVLAVTGRAALSDPWWGLAMRLNLGSPGGLAAKLGFTASLLLGWRPNETQAETAIGIQLPGSNGKEVVIQGPLKLQIGDIQLLADAGADGPAYLMRFANALLQFFGTSFPPGGQTNVLLFGDPDPNSTTSSLGWYGAYKKDAGPTGSDGGTGASAPTLVRGPRSLRGAGPTGLTDTQEEV
jgi:hypothetical protein